MPKTALAKAASIEQQEMIFNYSVDMTFLLSVEAPGRYRFISVNNAFLNSAGLTREQVEGKYADEVIPASVYPLVARQYEQAIREKQTVQREDTSEYPGGKRTGIISITPVCNEHGDCTMLVGTMHDITERKNAEVKLKQREAELNLIYNTINDVIFLVTIEPGPRYKFSSVNLAFLQTTGLSREQIVGQYVDAIIPEPSLSTVLANYEKAIREKNKQQWEETSMYPAGTRTGIVTITPVFNNNGDCEMLVGTVHDITERVEAQKEKDKIAYSLGERVKELTLLYKVNQLLHWESGDTPAVMQMITDSIPAGWQYPEITAARIRVEGREYRTPNFRDTAYRQIAFFDIEDVDQGLIEVVYLEERPAEAEGPFLAEERNLVNMLAELLRLFFFRKRTSEQLVKQHALLESMMTSLPGIFYVTEITGEMIRWNAQLELITGYSGSEISSRHPLDFVDDKDRELLLKKSMEMYRNGSSEAEVDIITKSGEKIPYLFTGQLIEYEDRTCMIGMGVDLTERRKVEESNRRNEEKFRVLVDAAPDATVIVNEKGIVQMVNRQAEVVFGYKREELIGHLVEILIPQEFHGLHKRYLENFQKETRTREMGMGMELFAVKKDGSRIPVEISLSPLHSEEGLLVTASIRDITERKKAAEQLHREKEISDRIIETLPGLFYIIDTSAKYIRWNKRKEAISGYSHEEMSRMNSLDFFAGEDKENIANAIRRGFLTGATEVEAYVLTKDGRKIPHFFTGVVVDFEGQPCLMGMGFDITERKKASEELLKQKELLESIINTLPGIFYVFDANGKYLMWNKNHETVPGYTTEEMQHMYPLNFFDEEERPMITERISKVFTEGYAEAEANFMGKDGTKTPYYFNGIVIDYDNKPCLMGVGIDITQRKKVETELREAENKFRTLVERSQVGVYIVQKGRFVYVNPRFCEIYGYSEEEMLAMDPLTTIINEQYKQLVMDNITARVNGDLDSVHYEVTGIKKDGTPNRVEFFGTRTMYEGKPTIIGTMVDITERARAEEALRKSDANLHTLFDNTETKYALLDTNLHFMSYNQGFADFVKEELHKEIQPNTHYLQYVPKGKEKAVEEKIKAVLEGGTANYEVSYPQPGGQLHWYDVRYIAVKDNSGHTLGLMVALLDITEKKLLEQKVTDQKIQEQKKMTRAVLNAQEKERNKIGQELHDNVNQILVGAKMYLGSIKENNEQNLDIVRHSISLLDNAINEIRALTREQVTPQRQIDLKNLIQSLVDNMKKLSRIEVDFYYDTGEYKVKDDLKINIYRIVQEGINNILKHASAKRVSIIVKADAEGLHVEITDDGVGFSSSLAGTKGIGITNILNRVESYNGRVFIESQPGPGCKIDITVPI